MKQSREWWSAAIIDHNEYTKVQTPRLCACAKHAYVRARNRLTSKPSGSVHLHCWKHYSFDRSSTHACTPSCCNPGASLYIEQEKLITGKPE